MTACPVPVEVCKRPDEEKEYGFDWTHAFTRVWEADKPYAAAARVRPSTIAKRTGFEYASSGGQSSGRKEPAWPVTGTVVDGSITWTTNGLSNTGLVERITSAAWEADPGITVTPVTPDDLPGLQRTVALISGGTNGTEYLVICEVTTSLGHVYEGVLKVLVQEDQDTE